MTQGDQKSLIDQEEKDQMLDDLESLSRMLDEEQEGEDDDSVISQDIPVLKSFVDDVPVLNETMEEAPEPEPEAEPPTITDDEPPVLQTTDSLDLNAGQFSTSPAPRPAMPTVGIDKLDMSFLDKDPLDISDRVRSYRQGDAPQAPAADAAPSPAPPPEHKPVQASEPAVPRDPAPAAEPAPEPAPTPAAPVESKADEVTRPLNRFQSSTKENPFLPRSTLDKIKENHAWAQNHARDDDASAQLRKLLQDNPLNKVNFDPNSKEAQALRQKASQMVNEVIRSTLPRLEAELRMKLEQEVDRMFKEIKKNPR